MNNGTALKRKGSFGRRRAAGQARSKQIRLVYASEAFVKKWLGLKPGPLRHAANKWFDRNGLSLFASLNNLKKLGRSHLPNSPFLLATTDAQPASV
jgi:hypothetical protein